MLRVRAAVWRASRGFRTFPRAAVEVKNEPILAFREGSAERTELLEALDSLKGRTEEIPCVVGDEHVWTSDVRYQLSPFNHSHRVAKFCYADKDLINKAIEASVSARREWDLKPVQDRAQILFKAADIISGPRRAEILAKTMIGQVQESRDPDWTDPVPVRRRPCPGPSQTRSRSVADPVLVSCRPHPGQLQTLSWSVADPVLVRRRPSLIHALLVWLRFRTFPRAAVEVKNEPILAFREGSAERTELLEALDSLKGRTEEIPCVVGDEHVWTSDVRYQLSPFNHSHRVAKFCYADKDLINKAIEASVSARREWDLKPVQDRAQILFKAADIISGPRRAEILAKTMIGQVQESRDPDWTGTEEQRP
uniref:Delta-1-pyrroline-5-carboxylate dehydrogenase, mitochondrial n=1 Tax=Larimichthys crocea TaxID=215358 RepID=A0A0F8ADR9_LARCR